MKAIKQIIVAVVLVLVSATALVAEPQQSVEKSAPRTLVSPTMALNSLLDMTESQMISLDHKAIGTITAANAFESTTGSSTRSTQAAFILVRASDECGQMVEYLRMNGIAPPSSGAPAPPKK